jgi:benzaldehyde dehydrogenase (NAD)
MTTTAEPRTNADWLNESRWRSHIYLADWRTGAGDGGLRALELAERIPSGAVHVNDQTVSDEPVIPFGGVAASGNGSRMGGIQANLDAYTETQWVTARTALPDYPF